MNPDAIPEELRERDQWYLWGTETDPPKKPLNAKGRNASWTDPGTGMSFADAMDKIESIPKADGIGFSVLENDPYIALDLDGVLKEPRKERPKDWVPDLEFIAGTWAEYSQSGTGIHVFTRRNSLPDWWSNVDYDEDNHEGVEAYEESFIAFTGDVVGFAGGEITDAEIAPFLFNAYSACEGENPRVEAKDDQEEFNSDSDLSEEQVRDALEHVDPDLHYSDWLRVGMAVYDWDSGSTGKRLFENWSKSNPKWDASDGQPTIDDIWSGSPNGDVTVGTLVYHAKKGGWEPPWKSADQQKRKRRKRQAKELTKKLDKAVDSNNKRELKSLRRDIRRLVGKVEDNAIEEQKQRILDVLEWDESILEEHRELAEERRKSSAIRVKNGQTQYIMLGDDGYFPYTVLNFEFDIQSILNYQTRQFVEATLNKQNGPSYDVQFEPKDLKRKQRFEDNVIANKFGLNYDPPRKKSQKVLNELNEYIANTDAPVLEGTREIGLHNDEWVTPEGSLRSDGWTDDPQTVYLERDIGVERKVVLTPEKEEVDSEDVEQILRLLPKTRDTERFLPVLGWFYAAPFRPYIYSDWSQAAFNHLSITGDTGSGKTAILRYLTRCFGLDGDPLDVEDTNFALAATMASSNGIPIWYDEYKPGDIADYKLNTFHNYLRKAATGGTAQRGNQDQSTTEYDLNAPLVVSGEEQIKPPAERRRTIMTTLKKSVTDSGTDTREAFKDITGGGRIEDGEVVLTEDAPDPLNHALAYLQWVAGTDPQELRSLWEDAREMVYDYRVTWDSEYDLDDLEVQGLQTVIFGWNVMRQFAKEYGVSWDELPQEHELEKAVQHVASQIGPDGQRKSHMDRFVEMIERAASADYVEEGTHYAFVHEGEAGEELRFHGRKTFDALSKYAKDHDLGSEDLLSNWGDYHKRFKEAADADGGYVTTASQPTPGIGRCVGISSTIAINELDFDRATFDLLSLEDESEGEGEGEGEGNGLGAVPLAKTADRKGDYVTVTVEVLTVDSFGDGDGAEAVLQDSTGIMEIKTWENDWVEDLQGVEGKAVVIQDAKVRYDDYDDSMKLKPVDNLTEFEEVQHGVGYTEGDSPDGQTELDESGGVPEDATGPLANAKRLKSVLDERGPMDKQEAATTLVSDGQMSGQEFDAALEKARHEQGWIEQDGDELRAL